MGYSFCRGWCSGSARYIILSSARAIFERRECFWNYLSVNQTTSTGADFLNFQLSSSSIFKIASSGIVSIGAASSSEGQLVFNNSNTSFGVTLQANTSTAKNFTLTLPNSTGTAGQVLTSDGSGNLSWDSTGFTKIVSSTASFIISSTSLVVYASTTFTPANTADQLWVTADISVSSTQITAAASTTMAIFRMRRTTARAIRAMVRRWGIA